MSSDPQPDPLPYKRTVKVEFQVSASTGEDADKLAELVADDLIEAPELWIETAREMQKDQDPEIKAVTPQGELRIVRGPLTIEANIKEEIGNG